jgi:hypothetical protein
MKLLEKTLVMNTVEVTREELLILKNVLYEAYVEIGEWEFTRRIGIAPEEALSLLKAINSLLKNTI